METFKELQQFVKEQQKLPSNKKLFIYSDVFNSNSDILFIGFNKETDHIWKKEKLLR